MISLKDLLFEQDRAYQGVTTVGVPTITVTGNSKVYSGRAVRGAPLYTIVGNKLFKGNTISGVPLATLVGDLVFRGIQITGSPIARLKGIRSYKGVTQSGYPLVTVPSGNIQTLFAATYHTLLG